MGYQDASGRRLNYDSYLRIPQLLELQQGLTQAHDELLFIVVHQVYELWFKVLIDELESVRGAIETEDLRAARHSLARVKVIEHLLVEQVAVLETMAPQDFLTFRSELAPASGFQSVQFREIEFLSGLKDAGYIKTLDKDGDARARLQRRLDEPSLHDAFSALMERGFIQASLQPRTRVPILIQRLDVPGILQTRQELDLAKLDGLKTAGRRQL